MADRKLEEYSRTSAQNSDPQPNGFPEGWLGEHVNNSTREMVGSLMDWYFDPQWVELLHDLAPRGAKTLTRDSATQITITGVDATVSYKAGRRCRIVGGTTGTGVIDSSTFTAGDTVCTVTMDGGDVPTSPTRFQVFAADEIGTAGFKDEGPGSGLDADTVDGFQASELGGARNEVINGDFLIWQRGRDFIGIAAAQYTADRWRYDPSGGTADVSIKEFALGQTDVPGEPTAYMNISQSSATGPPLLEERIENVRTKAGATVVVSAYLRADSAISVDMELEQNFGTGGTPSSAVVTALGTAAVTTSWQRFEFSVTVPALTGKTLGADGNDYLAVRFKGPGATTYALDVADVQLEDGTQATEFVRLTLATQLRMCQRYYEKSFPVSVKPESGTHAVNDLGGVTTMHNVNGFAGFSFGYSVEKRATPTLTIYHPYIAPGQPNDTGNFGVVGGGASAVSPVGSVYVGNGSFSLSVGNGVFANAIVTGDYTAESEL